MLWQGETTRVAAEGATLYSNFEDDELFLAAAGHAQSLGIMLWLDNTQRLFAARRLGERARRRMQRELPGGRAVWGCAGRGAGRAALSLCAELLAAGWLLAAGCCRARGDAWLHCRVQGPARTQPDVTCCTACVCVCRLCSVLHAWRLRCRGKHQTISDQCQC